MTVTRLPAGEQTRARSPDEAGYVERGGVNVFWERYGDGTPTVLFLPTWSIVHSRIWKGQIPYFARHARVLTFDGRGNGRSDRPLDPGAYAETEFAADALAVLDETETERAFIVGLSLGAQRGLLLAAEHPERVEGVVFVGPALPLACPDRSGKGDGGIRRAQGGLRGLGEAQPPLLARGLPGLSRVLLLARVQRTALDKQIEDCVGWGLETDARDADRDHARHGPGRGGDACAPRSDHAARSS